MSSCYDQTIRDFWTLTTEESTLLPGMTDKGRLGFATQLKFIDIHGRFPEHHNEIDPQAVQWLATQIKVTPNLLVSYDFHGRQSRRHRRTIRVFLGFHPITAVDLKRLATWLTDDVLPFDPQARHGRELAFDWCATQRMEPPASAHLERIIRSAVHHYETQQFLTIETRLTARHRASINRLIARDFPDTDEACDEIQTATTLSQLKRDPGKANLDSLLTTIAKLKCINEIGLLAEIFQDIPQKFIDQHHQRCATESIRELRRHPDAHYHRS